MKKIFNFIIVFLPWFISSIFINNSFYNEIELPFFAPPSIIFKIIWPILYFLIALSIYYIMEKISIKNLSKNYKQALIINYILNQLFIPLFFGLKSPFLGFIIATAIFITSLFLYVESASINEKSGKLLIPYIMWNLFAAFLSLNIYLLNY